MKNIRNLERVRGRRRRRENWYGKRGGGGNSTVFKPATVWSQHKKKRFVREIKGKELKRRSMNSHMHKTNKEHASEEVRRF